MKPSALLLTLLCATACGSKGSDEDLAADARPEEPGDTTPSYTDDIQPILAAKCGPCHTSGGAGGVNHASDFAATQGDSAACAGARVFECMLTRVENGSMPAGAGCSGDPAADSGNPSCLTAEEQMLLADWVAAGAPQGPAETTPPPDPDPYPGY